MSHVLCFDLGTTYFKAAVFDRGGKLLALARRSTPTQRPQPGWAEYEQPVFLQTLRDLAGDLRAEDAAALGEVRAVSFASQANSFLLLDEHDEPVTPIIVWNDRRAEPIADDLARRLDDPERAQRTGVPALSGGFMVAKWLWLSEHEPERVVKARRLCLISDEFTRWLTGEHVTEAGVAGLTGIVDIHDLTWRSEAVKKLGLDAVTLPRVVRAGTVVGPLLPEAAQVLGVPADCRFVVGCLDQYAGAIGAGNVAPGGLSETTGTVLATVRLSDHPRPMDGDTVYQGPAFSPGAYFQMCFGPISASLLEVYRQTHAPQASYDELVREAAAVGPGAGGLTLDRQRSAAGDGPVFAGETPAHTRGHHVRAILEAVADALVEQAGELTGDEPAAQVRSVGGAARSDVWLQIKADRLGVPVAAIDCPEPTCLGVAILATAALEGRPVPEVAADLVPLRKVFTPNR